MALIGQYKTVEIKGKFTVNVRRYNREVRRHKLALASFVPHVRLARGNKPTK